MEVMKGKKYLVKTWDKMVEEYGYCEGETDEIATPAVFVENMRCMCGKIVTVISEPDRNGFFDIDEFPYRWDACMLLPVEGSISYLLEVRNGT